MSEKQDYLRTRKTRVRQLYLRDNLEAPAIAARLIEDGTIETKSEESALRLVRADVAEIKKEIAAERGEIAAHDGGASLDAQLKELERLEFSYRGQVALAENDEIVTTVIPTQNGEMVIEKPKVAAGVKQRALKDAAIIAQRIAEKEAEIAKATAEQSESGEEAMTPGLTILESGDTIPNLIAKNNLRVN
jgi:hypothetical protein